MNPKTAKSLVWFSAILIAVGLMAPNPALRYFLYIVAAISALPPFVFTGGWSRLPGGIALAAACVLASRTLPQFRREMRGYETRVSKKVNKGALETRKELSKAR